MNIIVVGNKHRKPLITEHLQNYRHQVHYCRDYDLPANWIDRHKVIFNTTGHLRAFRGHQDALIECTSTCLVFEDDAVPLSNLWPLTALSAYAYLDDFDWISLHGREYSLLDFTKIADLGHGYALYTNNHAYGINGCCMAYWMKASTAERFREADFDGYPDDHYLWQRFNAAIVDPSPFKHDRSQGSLIDKGARN